MKGAFYMKNKIICFTMLSFLALPTITLSSTTYASTQVYNQPVASYNNYFCPIQGAYVNQFASYCRGTQNFYATPTRGCGRNRTV
jgi:hypothetical protein